MTLNGRGTSAARPLLERLENRADQRRGRTRWTCRSRAFDVLAEEGGRVERVRSDSARTPRGTASTGWSTAPCWRCMSLNSTEADQGQRVARRLLLLVESHRGRASPTVIVPVTRPSTPVASGHDRPLAAADELGAHLLGDLSIQVEHRGAVGEQRHADPLDVGGQERAAAGQRIAAAAMCASSRERAARISRSSSYSPHHDADELAARHHDFLDRLAVECAAGPADRPARSRAAAPRWCRPARSRRPRTLPLTCTGTTIWSAFATASS